ncbi:phage portal protein [Clostridium sp. ASF356]|nr:phage portal protein [Clostridium sp. MD294]
MGDVYYINKKECKGMQAYYKQNRKEIKNKKIVISERLVDKQGNVVVWEIRPLSQKENENILKKCRAMKEEGKQNLYEVMVLVESVVFPDLSNVELQNKYHVIGKEALLLEMLTAGEYEKLKNVVEEVQ